MRLLYYTYSRISNLISLEKIKISIQYRWLNFCVYWGFVQKNSITSYTWLPDIAAVHTSYPLWIATKNAWITRIVNMMELFGAIGSPKAYNLGLNFLYDMNTNLGNYPGFKKFSFADWEGGNNNGRVARAQAIAEMVLIDKFLTLIVKPNLQAECTKNGISLN